MGFPVTSAFSRRDRLWPAVGASLAAHALLVGWAVANRPAPAIDLEQKAIVAKLVRLGEKRPQQYLPRKDAGAPAAPAPAPAPIAAPATAVPAPRTKPAPPQAAAERPAGPSLSSILSKVQRDVDERRYGDPEGDAAGDADSPSEGDRYVGLVTQALQRNYDVPKTIPQQELSNLKATVILRIDARGRIVGHEFERRSGNASYDAALERAISRTQVPPPPPSERDHYARIGLGVKFHL